MEVNERRTVVGGSLTTVCPPNRGERSTRMLYAYAFMLISATEVVMFYSTSVPSTGS